MIVPAGADVGLPFGPVKGGDYTLDRLPEARQVRAWGARALVLPLREVRSTTALIARIRAGAR